MEGERAVISTCLSSIWQKSCLEGLFGLIYWIITCNLTLVSLNTQGQLKGLLLFTYHYISLRHKHPYYIIVIQENNTEPITS